MIHQHVFVASKSGMGEEEWLETHAVQYAAMIPQSSWRLCSRRRSWKAHAATSPTGLHSGTPWRSTRTLRPSSERTPPSTPSGAFPLAIKAVREHWIMGPALSLSFWFGSMLAAGVRPFV